MLKYLLSILLFLALPVQALAFVSDTSLAGVAEKLKPGEWGELLTTGASEALTNSDGSLGYIIHYADTMARVGQYAYFIGSDHGSTSRFVRLDTTTGAWTTLPRPAWLPPTTAYLKGMLHGYHHLTANPAQNLLYARRTKNIYRYQIATETWETLPEIKNWQPNFFDALEYFPEAGGLIWATGYGDIWLWVEAESKWKLLATGMPKGGTWTTSVYDPVHHVVLVYAAGSLLRINATGTVERMRPPPVAVYDGSSFNGALIADPQSGRIVVTSAGKRELAEYDVPTDTWRKLPNTGGPSLANGGMVGFSDSDLGVIVYSICKRRGDPCRTYVYRHDGSNKPDTVPPCLSLQSPTNTAGRLHFSATAMDNVGVFRVQWMVDGQPWGGPKTAPPYETDWNSTWFPEGKHTITATARDFAGNTSEATFEVTTNNPVSAATGPLSYAERCAQPGVIRCYGFDDEMDLTTGHPRTLTTPADATTSRIYPPGGNGAAKCAGGKCWTLDTDIKASGPSSLRFEIPGLTPGDMAGSFRLNFADDFSKQIGEGEEFYVQWRQRWTPGMLRTFKAKGGGNTTWKLAILGAGDQPGRPIAYSCTSEEMVLVEDARSLGPTFYHSCGTWTNMDYWSKEDQKIKIQHVGSPGCFYPNDPTAGCFRFVADEWMTLKMHVRVVGFGATPVLGNRVRVWAAREGQASTLVFDSINSHPNGFPIRRTDLTSKYGKVWFTPYMTNKDNTEAHPTEYTWYDDLIISREDIADPK